MKLISVELAQCAVMGTFFSPHGIHPVEAVKAIHEKYMFTKVPQAINELDPTVGIEFNSGKFSGSVIQKLTVYRNGILVQSANSVEHAEEFLSDVLAWAGEHYGTRIIDSLPIQRSFDSHIVFQTEIDISMKFSVFDAVLEKLNSIMMECGIDVPKYTASGIVFHTDLYERAGLKPGNFLIERRAQIPYSNNTFFSMAPIKTKSHIELIESVESLLR